MNGSNGIVPTVDLATNNTYPYPVYANGGFGGNSGFFGGDGIWALVLLALLFGNNGWGGFGGNNGWGGNNLATTDFVSSEFTQRDISQLSNTTTTGFGNLSTQLCNCCSDINGNIANGFYNTANNICNLRSDILTGNMGLQNSILDSKYNDLINAKDTQRDILLQTTQLENQASINALNMQSKLDECCCDLKAQGIENTSRILEALNNSTINDLREKLNEAQTEISNRNIESSIINSVRPYPTPAWLVSSPYQSIYNPYGFNGGFYGNGFYGNTIV